MRARRKYPPVLMNQVRRRKGATSVMRPRQHNVSHVPLKGLSPRNPKSSIGSERHDRPATEARHAIDRPIDPQGLSMITARGEDGTCPTAIFSTMIQPREIHVPVWHGQHVFETMADGLIVIVDGYRSVKG